MLASPEEKEVEKLTEPPEPGELPVRDDDEVTTCSQDSVSPPITALLAPTVAVPLFLLSEAPSVAVSSTSLESPQTFTFSPREIRQGVLEHSHVQ